MTRTQTLRKCNLKKDCSLLRHFPKKGQEIFCDQQESKSGYEIVTIGRFGQYHLGYMSWGQIKEFVSMTGTTIDYNWKTVE